MEKLHKISYELDSDSDSTITDIEILTESINDSYKTQLNVPSTSKTTFSNCFSEINYKQCDELESILQKYGVSVSNTKSQGKSPMKTSVDNIIELSSDEEVPQSNVFANTESNKELNPEKRFSPLPFQREQEEPLAMNDDKTETLRKRKHQPTSNSIKDKNKQEKAEQKAQRLEEIAKSKRIKQVLNCVNKHTKPEECLKFITVKIGEEIAKEHYSEDIFNALKSVDVKYHIESHLIPNVVTWSREAISATTNDRGELVETLEIVQVDDILVIMNWDQIIGLVDNNTLNSQVQSIKSILNKKKLFLVIYGLGHYFRYHKRQKNREVRNQVSQSTSIVVNKNDQKFEYVPKVSKAQFDLAFTELQVLHSCCYRLIENPEDLGTLITQFTKSVASAPFKFEKYQQQLQANWYMAGDNKDCVNVDKSGNGLKRLWQQQLTTFPLARLEHAEAIMSKYPTLRSLLEEYNLTNNSNGETVLQDIPIRRAAGPLTSCRRLGVEFSKKVYTFFSSLKGDMVL